MTFTIVGTGNMAWFIGTRLVAARHHCKGVFGRNAVAVNKLAEALLCNNFGDIKLANEAEADVCFITVSDNAVKEVAQQLHFKKTVLVHTAGAVPISVLESASADCAVLWPVYSISSTNLPAHRNIPCAWEVSSPRAEKYALSLAHVITDILFQADFEQRKWLHLSAVICNNFTNHLMAICRTICAEKQLPFEVLEPIIDLTFRRFRQQNPLQLQTGPAIRHDSDTITEQIGLLATHPEWQRIYEAMTESIQKMGKD